MIPQNPKPSKQGQETQFPNANSLMAGGANFGFLEQHDPQLMHLAQRAERYLADDPNTCLIKLRQFGELLIKHVAAQHRLQEAENFAASIIGFIRPKTLRSPLIPSEERIAKQLKKEVIVDHHALDQGEFAAHGGFQNTNKKVDGQLANLLAQFQDAIWDDVA